MVEVQSNITGNGNGEFGGEVGGIEAKRAKLRFKRATINDTTATFGDSSTAESKPRRQRSIAAEKRASVTASDTGNFNKKVRGKAPNIPAEEEDDSPKRRGVRKRVGKGYKVFPTVEDSKSNAQFLLSAIEVAAVTSVGPRGEMTQWERGILGGPLQRIIARTPLSVVEKGGIIFDIGFLVMGGSIYFSRVLNGFTIPQIGKKKSKGTQEDTQAPMAAPVEQIVDNVKAGDLDGLAQPIPREILANMNGVI